MPYSYCRIILLALLVCSFLVSHFVYPYIILWIVYLEYLNRRQEYTSQHNFRKYNLIFTIYAILIFNRFVFPHTPHLFREIINRGEHAMLAIVLCLAFMQGLKMNFFKLYNFNARLVIASLAFQVLGIANEIYQASWTAGSMRLYFSPDARLDLVTNVLGNVIFIAMVYRTHTRKNAFLSL